MPESIKHRVNALPDTGSGKELKAILDSILADLTAIRTSVNTHTHGGVTTGGGTSGAANANTVGTLNTTS